MMRFVMMMMMVLVMIMMMMMMMLMMVVVMMTIRDPIRELLTYWNFHSFLAIYLGILCTFTHTHNTHAHAHMLTNGGKGEKPEGGGGASPDCTEDKQAVPKCRGACALEEVFVLQMSIEVRQVTFNLGRCEVCVNKKSSRLCDWKKIVIRRVSMLYCR